ncbi:MAG: DNA translocase FtsK [Clostridia bacterium]|nr:DNA translocase FtsK [Clostridia bacterium]
MATFQVSKNNKNKSTKNKKVIAGWILLALSTFIFLFSVTRLLPFLQWFFLGVFGIFVYPLTVVGMIVSLALLNNKKYVMSKKYAIFLILSLVLLLAIIQLIILGSAKGLKYGEFVALNYTKQFTAGGMLIGFIPSTLMYLMGPAATYIILSLAFLTCVAFFVEALLSMKKTKEAEEPIKLQIKQREKTIDREENREEKIFQKENTQSKKVEEINVMLGGNIQEEEKKELSAREKLGLVGGYKQPQTETYQPHQMVFPKEEKKEEKVPEGMNMREYLLSPPKVDLNKFREQQSRNRTYSNYFLNQMSPEQTNTVSSQSVNTTQNEIAENLDELKNDVISTQPQSEQQSYFDGKEQVQGNLPEVKPEEITNEAEDIIRSVVEQEKLEREEEISSEEVEETFVQEEPIVEEEEIVSAQEEEKVSDDYNEFIDFDDIDDTPAVEEKEEKFDNIRDRQNFSRDLPQRNQNNFSRDERGFSRDNMGQNPLQRDGSMQRENALAAGDRGIEGRENPFRQHNDEMERRKSFVQTPETKKEEIIKPYKYTRPSLDLITTASDDPATFNAEMTQKSVALENALESFGIPAKVQSVVIGPTVTRYEIEMPEGISVKRILSLDADIAYALSANGQIRIEAPIPGRSIVGIEVPNKKIAMVSIKDVLNAKEFTLSPSPLTFALGKDITGNVKVCNLQKMPHLLVAGTTGSGKSVCLNTIITSLLYKSSPDEVKFIMIDPKQVELSMYEGLPHMIIPKVITDPTKAVNALGWAVDEMERRFRLISEERVRNIDEYNKTERVLQAKAKKMPYIVIIFDEFADFMAVAKNEIEDKIRRLAGKARAAGIHLILATQRPSTDVVTGTLKANLPARIAFRVAGRVDSEVILGSTGADKLLGNGDMLYKPADTAPQRIQGCYIATGETKDIVNFIIDNNEETFDPEALEAINNPNKNKNGGDGEGKDGVDPLLPQALKICIDNGVASTTMVQRKLSIGYPRAARIIDQMEERNYISSADGAKQRSVYISIEEFYSIFGDIYD